MVIRCRKGQFMTEDRRCLVVDRQPVVRLGIRELLASRFVVEEAADWPAARDLLTDIGAFDVAVVDIDRTGDGLPAGATLIKALRREHPAMGLVAHTGRAETVAATEAMDAGASAFVVRSSPAAALREAVEAAAERSRFVDPAATGKRKPGTASLTKRQRQILQLLADGHSTISAAEQLGLSSETVRTHAKGVLGRLHARDRAHAVAIGLRAGLID
jgi:DNA-binding NarL/FixJ family response regulator